ncbi:MAG: hypothetical protein ACI9EW_001745 [Cellvibrionaceae bacterium]|jgi:hypothetical protein
MQLSEPCIILYHVEITLAGAYFVITVCARNEIPESLNLEKVNDLDAVSYPYCSLSYAT